MKYLLTNSVPNVEEVLNEANNRLDAVRQKIGHIAEELGEDDLYQFHKAFMPGEFHIMESKKKMLCPIFVCSRKNDLFSL